MKLLIVTQAVNARHPVLGFFVRWIEEFAKHAEVQVICLEKGEYALPENVHVYSLGKERGGSRGSSIFTFYTLVWRLRHNYDVVFVHMNPEYFVLAGTLWRLWGKRTALWYTHKNVNLWLRIAVAFANTIYTASKESFRLKTRKLKVMGHGIDTTRQIPDHVPATGVTRLMTSGRISTTKGLAVIIGAFLELQKRGIASTLTAFGAPVSAEDMRYQEALSVTLAEQGKNPNEVFVGSVPHAELPRRRASMDYFLHASETGSLDKTVLDAAMSDVIPISSSEAYGEFLAGFEKYLVYPKGDSAALADRVLALQSLPEEQRAGIRAALKNRVIEKHSLQSLISAIVKNIQSV
jgi:glycosyltransferase involved in cell wall biosynthesis